MTQDNNTYVVIMAGGIGSRFWPVSRNAFPKQFIDIMGVGKTLLQLTYERFLPICKKENIFIVSNEQYRDLIAEQLPDLNLNQLLCEPMRKNTAPCVMYACTRIKMLNENANIIIAASDHFITKINAYHQVLQKALEHVSKHNHLVTLGIEPTRPDTGYGYIQFEQMEKDGGVHKVKTFTEKPNYELAVQFIKSEEFLWNSGMFIWNVKTILKAIEQHLPEVTEAFKDAEKHLTKKSEAKFIADAYSQCTNISIDFGVMEKAKNVRVIPSGFGWSDVGTWDSLYNLKQKDYYDNAVSGKNVFCYDAQKNMVHVPDKKLVIIQGLDNYIVVDTPDALLICSKTSEQKIKDYTADVKKTLGDKFL
jgi:mannose-1-phosphate guanylyltransferase